VSDLKEALSLVPGHREIHRLLARIEDELDACLNDGSGQTTILPDSLAEISPRTTGIPDIVPGALCTDVDSFDASEQNDKHAS